MATDVTIGKLTATRRNSIGKKITRKLRATGKLPAVCYGKKQGSIPIVIDPAELTKAADPQRGRNTVFDLVIQDGDKSEELKVMLKEYQVDSIRQTLVHADFIRVSMDEDVQVDVPLELTGKPVGVKTGGNLHQVFRTLPVKCRPANIPSSLSIDVTPLQLGDSLSVSDLELPPGIEVLYPENQTIALIMAPRALIEATAATEEEAEGAAEEGGTADAAQAEGQ
jgi:large subunit ribosomal protein L25